MPLSVVSTNFFLLVINLHLIKHGKIALLLELRTAVRTLVLTIVDTHNSLSGQNSGTAEGLHGSKVILHITEDSVSGFCMVCL